MCNPLFSDGFWFARERSGTVLMTTRDSRDFRRRRIRSVRSVHRQRDRADGRPTARSLSAGRPSDAGRGAVPADAAVAAGRLVQPFEPVGQRPPLDVVRRRVPPPAVRQTSQEIDRRTAAAASERPS